MENFKTYDVVIVGAGIFGISTAIELAKRGMSICVLNPDSIPHHLASSTDISKAVRMEYGSDWEYLKMAEYSIGKWRHWNEVLPEKVYHEVGFLMLCTQSRESEYQRYERESLRLLKQAGYKSQSLNRLGIKEKYPFVNIDKYIAASFNPVAGYAESGKAVLLLSRHAQNLGVDIIQQQSVAELLIQNRTCTGVKTKAGRIFNAGQVLVSAGACTHLLVPDLEPFIKITGHSVFWVKPEEDSSFRAPKFSVFTADISNSGWYGFPVHPETGVLKIGKHSLGESLHPEKDSRIVKENEIEEFRSFLKESFPVIADAPLVYTRKCLYTDTLDGHFWIDNHPEVKGLSVCTGGSGHGFKMGPVVGEITADLIEGKHHEYAARYKWRELGSDTVQQEEARDIQGHL